MNPEDETVSDKPSGDDRKSKLVRRAKERWKRADMWESIARKRWIDDVKFYNGDAYNMYQWPDTARNARGFGTGDERPCLTVNEARQHCLQIINDMRQNKTSIKIKPTGNEATFEAAQILEGMVRHIEYRSRAQTHYLTATKFQIQGGLGYLKVGTDYVSNDTFDQEIKIDQVADPLQIFWDPDSMEPDGSDARFAYEFTDMPRDQFENEYPKYKDAMRWVQSKTSLGNDDGWIAEKHVRVAGYWYREEKRDTLIVFTDPVSGEKKPIKKSETRGWTGALKDALEEQLEDPDTQTREIVGHEVKWARIIGDEVAEERDWPGTTIPLVPVLGERTVIEGELDRKGHIRAMIDEQRMLNYNASAAIEQGALQTKSPYIAAAAAIEGNNDAWEQANVQNFAVLTWNHVDDDTGLPIPAPIKIQPPTSAPLYMEGMKTASDQMKMVSGQYAPVMGEPSNERSGKAIQARQRQGENATYHFIDHQATAIRRVGQIIIELIPKIYDTKRIIKIMGEDGKTSDVLLDPEAQKAYEKRKNETANTAEQVVVNPTIGLYDVMSDVGPDYATRRQEAFNALSQIAQASPELMGIIGDLVMLAADFPLADEAAERLKRMVPAQALGEGQNPQVAKLQQQIQAMQGLLASLSNKAVEAQSKASNASAQKQVDTYKAVTDRLKVWLDHYGLPASEAMAMMHDLAKQEHSAQITFASQAMDAALQPQASEDQDQAA